MSLENSTIPVVSSSPERNTFQKENYIKRQEEAGEPLNDAYIEMWESQKELDAKRILDPEWQKCNLEYDLRSTDWILEKVRTRDAYAQNLYAALCNMQWRSKEFWPTLKEQNWSCSWRHAGGIIADMQQKGDYIDWYCSGIKGDPTEIDYVGALEQGMDLRNYVSEGHVTEEIATDLDRLGWTPHPFED